MRSPGNFTGSVKPAGRFLGVNGALTKRNRLIRTLISDINSKYQIVNYRCY